MKTYQQFITERFINLFPNDVEKRQEIVDDVWNILQASYKAIGGIHGKGFSNKEEMIKVIPFWKLVRKNGKIVSVAMYKDKAGRKFIAGGTDGSEDGKNGLFQILKDDLLRERAFGELSDRMLSFLVKQLGYDTIKKFAILPSKLKTFVDDEILDVDSSDPEITRHPILKDYFYRRDIGGNLHTKIALGTSGKNIVGFPLK